MKPVHLRSSTRAELNAAANAERLARAAEEIGGTPETLAKLRADPHAVDVLLGRGAIDGGQAKVLLAIEAGYRLITEDVAPKISSPVRSDRGERAEREWEIRCVTRYREWALDLIGPKLICQRVCLMVAVDGMALRDMERQLRKRNGAARELLLHGLKAYHEVKRRIR